jgi:hypothetical protein
VNAGQSQQVAAADTGFTLAQDLEGMLDVELLADGLVYPRESPLSDQLLDAIFMDVVFLIGHGTPYSEELNSKTIFV